MSETRYAVSGEVSIAYRVEGEGPIDVLFVPGIVSHVEAFDELPGYRRFVGELARSARVITFDKRGNGLSDRVAEPPTLEDRMADVRAVLDALGSERAVLFGVSEGGPTSLLFAATYPERTVALVLFGAFARAVATEGGEPGLTPEAFEKFAADTVAAWGSGAALLTIFGPSLAALPDVRPIAARCERASATPTTLRALWRMAASIDVRDVLPAIAAPALVLHRTGDRVVPVAVAHALARGLARGRLVELEGDDHFPFAGDAARVLKEVRAFLEQSGIHAPPPSSPLPPPRPPPLETPTEIEQLLEATSFDEPLVLGRFVVERPLGAGGMGAVFLARDRELSRLVALKVLRRPDAESFRRFRREAIAIARLSHPNVVGVYELGLDEATPYLVMEHVAGGSLANLRVVAPARAARLVASAARGLGAAHARGIVHRDVKPGNLLLVDADGDEVKVADFGVAKLVGSDPLTREGTLVGTVGYLAPEQIDGDADARTDVYALGVTLYRLLTGVLPWSGTAAEMMAAALLHGVPDPRAVVAGVPEALAKAVQTLGAVDPDRRPRDGADAAKLLADAG